MSNYEEPRSYSRAETADLIEKLQQGMQAKADPLRGAIMDALCASKDPRVSAVRRKCSFDQLRAIVDCAANAAEGRHPASTPDTPGKEA